MILSDTVQQRLQRLMRAGMDFGLARLTQISGAPWQAGGRPSPVLRASA